MAEEEKGNTVEAFSYKICRDFKEIE